MQRSTIGAIAVGAFTLGILAGVIVPAGLAQGDHGWWTDDHSPAPLSMQRMGSMPMLQMGSMMGSMPMVPMTRMPLDHITHHASPELPR